MQKIRDILERIKILILSIRLAESIVELARLILEVWF